MCPLRVLLLCPLRVLLLWALLCPGTGIIQEEIFTRPGSDLLLPIRLHLTLNHTDTERCDQIEWKYEDSTRHDDARIFIHRRCTLSKSENVLFPNMRLSENGSLIISNVTLENDGIYDVYIIDHKGLLIQKDNYTVHVEVPVSVPLLHVSCPRTDSAEISCKVEEGTKPNTCLSVIGGSQERYSTSANSITVIVGSPGPWNITCTVENGVSRSEESRAGATCPEESRSGMWSGWGHLLSHGVMCVLNTALLIYIVTDLRKVKNEKKDQELGSDRDENGTNLLQLK